MTISRMVVVCQVVLLSLFLVSCEEKAEEKGRDEGVSSLPRIAMLLYREDDAYIRLVKEAVEQLLSGRAELVLYNAGGDQLMQDEQLESALRANVQGVAVNLVDVQAAAGVVDTIKKAGLPVVFFNREPDLQSLRAHEGARFVGTTIVDAGKLQGDMIYRLWKAHPEFDKNSDGKCQYIMLQGNTDNPEAVARTEFSVRQARGLGVATEQLGQTYVCNWDRELARQSVEYAFAQFGDDIELIIANNDSMALGAIQALAKHGYNKEGDTDHFIPVVGVDAVPEAVEAINKGIMSATVKQDAGAMAAAIVDLLMNAVQGKDFFDATRHTYDESGIAVRIPYAPHESRQ